MADTTKYFNSPSVGLNNVGSYQVSGVPFITGSNTIPVDTEDKITFPMVARNVTVINHGTEVIRVHFNSKDDTTVITNFHFVELDSDEDSISMSVKCKEIYISTPATNVNPGNYRVIAELTQISTDRMYVLTGSGLTD